MTGRYPSLPLIKDLGRPQECERSEFCTYRMFINKFKLVIEIITEYQHVLEFWG